jgi:SAM-dependent methyltransferase
MASSPQPPTPPSPADAAGGTESDRSPEDLVNLLYRAVLRRPPEESGLSTYSDLVTAGLPVSNLIRMLMQSPEFDSCVLVPVADLEFGRLDDYDLAADKDISNYFTPEREEMANSLRRPLLDQQLFETASRDAIALAGEILGPQVGYFTVHRHRFFEINNAVHNIIAARSNSTLRLLDFGLSVNSFLIGTLFPNVEIHVADRPQVELPGRQFHGSYKIDLANDNLAEVTFGAGFDLILFAQVIEHVLVHPTDIIRFLLKHLTDDGLLIITTPNLFARSKLRLVAHRKNPLPPYPANAGRAYLPHFHVREYSMSEMLLMIEAAGGNLEAFFFSPCLNQPILLDRTRAEELANMFYCISKKPVPNRRAAADGALDSIGFGRHSGPEGQSAPASARSDAIALQPAAAEMPPVTGAAGDAPVPVAGGARTLHETKDFASLVAFYTREIALQLAASSRELEN